MIPGRLRQCLKILRWKADDLAAELGRRECEVKAWIEGHAPAPLAVAAWIESLAKAHETLAPPGRISTASKPRSTEIEPVEIRLPEAGYRSGTPTTIVTPLALLHRRSPKEVLDKAQEKIAVIMKR